LIDTFAGIICGLNGNPLERRYKQLASISTAASTIAAGPPYIRNVKKIKASAKLIANFERGSESVIRGAIKIENKTMNRYPGDNAAAGNTKADAAIQAAPILITAAFDRFDIFCRDIAEPSREREFMCGTPMKFGWERHLLYAAKQILTLRRRKNPQKMEILDGFKTRNEHNGPQGPLCVKQFTYDQELALGRKVVAKLISSAFVLIWCRSIIEYL